MATILTLQPELRTPRLVLRRLRPADAALIGLYASDARVAKMTATIPHPYPPGQAEAYVERLLARPGRETVWAIDSGAGQEAGGAEQENGLIGVIGLKALGDGSAEITYWLAPAFWGTGYASEAVEALLPEAGRRGLVALVAQVFQDNAGAARVLSRAGFGYIGESETFSVARNAMVPTFRYRFDLAPAGEP